MHDDATHRRPHLTLTGEQSSIFGDESPSQRPRFLVDRFIVPPFSVLDRRSGAWQKRRRAWLALGINDGITRDSRVQFSEMISLNSSVSAVASSFDPVIAEVLVSWFSREGDTVFDPFAGGPTRGIVTVMLGRSYVGFDLRPEQVEANIAQAAAIVPQGCAQPTWIMGDAMFCADVVPKGAPRFLMTCPPYGDLETYSDDPRDLSTLPPHRFSARYRAIVTEAVDVLAPDSFAAFVVGNYRDAVGYYVDLVGLTIEACREAGARFYNDVVIVDPVGTAALRAPGQFAGNRKVVKVHQNVLVFCKENWKAAVSRLGLLD